MVKHKWKYIFLDSYKCAVCGKAVIIGKSSKDDERNERLVNEECPGEYNHNED